MWKWPGGQPERGEAHGFAAYYILGYGTLAYVLSYYLLPAVWRFATPRRLVSQADVFTSAYGSRALGVLVSVVAVAAMIRTSRCS
jgi:SSS family solute:Na+ symporter